jgi:hypothetical protein
VHFVSDSNLLGEKKKLIEIKQKESKQEKEALNIPEEMISKKKPVCEVEKRDIHKSPYCIGNDRSFDIFSPLITSIGGCKSLSRAKSALYEIISLVNSELISECVLIFF